MRELDKTRWGTFVKTTPLAIKKFIYSEHKRGILLAESSGLVRVIPEGRVTSGWFSRRFWEVDD